jgi:hypothetical protein
MSESADEPDVSVASGVEAPPEVTAEPVPDVEAEAEAEVEIRAGAGAESGGEAGVGVDAEAGPAAVTEPEPDVMGVTDAPVEVGARYCWMCDDRVPLAADGLHCHLGHRLSPAHAKRRRGLFRRR